MSFGTASHIQSTRYKFWKFWNVSPIVIWRVYLIVSWCFGNFVQCERVCWRNSARSKTKSTRASVCRLCRPILWDCSSNLSKNARCAVVDECAGREGGRGENATRCSRRIYIYIYIYVMNIVLGVYLASILMLQQQTRSHLVPGKKQSDTGWVGKDMKMFDTTHKGDQT